MKLSSQPQLYNIAYENTIFRLFLLKKALYSCDYIRFLKPKQIYLIMPDYLIPIILLFPIFSFSQTPCDELNVDFPSEVTTETYFLSLGDTIFTQDTLFLETGIYTFHYQTITGCDSLVQISIHAPEVEDDFMYLDDTIYFEGMGCGNENIYHCMQFQSGAHQNANYTFNSEDIGTIAEDESCFELLVFGIHIINDFPYSPDNYPLQILSLLGDIGQTTYTDFYVNSPLELLYQIRAFIPGARIWLSGDGQIMIGDDVNDPDNFIYLIGTVKNANGEEWTFNIGNGIVDCVIDIIDVPSKFLSLEAGENVLEIYDPNSDQSKTIILKYDYSFPEIRADYFTYEMPLGETAIFPINSDDLCDEITSIENNCPELATNAAVSFTLQENQTVKFKAEKIGTSHACYELCEQSGRCDTFTLRVDVYEPRPEEYIPTTEDSLATHNLYPNPTSTIVHFTESLNVFIKKIIIYNSAGKLIDVVRLNETNVYDLDVSRYAEGLYIAVRELKGGEAIVGKFVVQR